MDNILGRPPEQSARPGREKDHTIPLKYLSPKML